MAIESKNLLVWVKAMSRGQALPLDASEIHDSLAAAGTYAASAIAYEGQTIKAKLEDGKLVTSGGRVTGTTAIADSLEAAIQEAYRLSDGVKFEGAYRRSDIGQRALQALK